MSREAPSVMHGSASGAQRSTFYAGWTAGGGQENERGQGNGITNNAEKGRTSQRQPRKRTKQYWETKKTRQRTTQEIGENTNKRGKKKTNKRETRRTNQTIERITEKSGLKISGKIDENKTNNGEAN